MTRSQQKEKVQKLVEKLEAFDKHFKKTKKSIHHWQLFRRSSKSANNNELSSSATTPSNEDKPPSSMPTI